MKFLYIFLLSGIILFNIKDSFGETKPAEEPKTKFTAKVDFKNWEAGVVACNKEVSSFDILGFGTDKSGITLSLDGKPELGTFEINKNSKHKASYGTVENKFIIGEKDFGKIKITAYDPVKKLISGTFELQLTNKSTGKNVRITQGEFKNLDISERPPMSGQGFKTKRNGIPWQLFASSLGASRKYKQVHFSVQDKEYALLIDFPIDIAPGEYFFATEGLYTAKYINYTKDGVYELLSKSGKLVILNNDGKTISGRFEVELGNSNSTQKVNFTDSEFTLFYTYY